MGSFVREIICHVFNYVTVDLLSCSPDAVCFLFVYSRFQIFIAVFIMQAAQEWLNIVSRIVSFESGMGSSVTAGLAFKLKRLTREYGAHSQGSIGRLSVAGTVHPIDVYRAFVECHSYKLGILNCLLKRRFDYDAVKVVLKQLITDEIEVVPQSFVIK